VTGGADVRGTGRCAAFFDVDDTLITVKSIFRFLAFDMFERGLPPGEYDRAMRQLRSLKAANVPREDVNRAYFGLWAGLDEAATTARGAHWFETERDAGELFHPEVLAAFRRHAQAGHRTVLVSGSFPACLEPIAAFLSADAVLCSRPQARDGRYTGEIAVPMIGEAKAAAVRAQAAAHGIDLSASYAYGDHSSDLPVLSLVGNPVVVGDDPVLTGQAILLGWARLPAADALMALSATA
jgi:HAD superfamily hydrolase (TIGR01490 family)